LANSLIVSTAGPRRLDHHDVLVTELSDGELYLIASGARVGHESEMKVLPPAPLKDSR